MPIETVIAECFLIRNLLTSVGGTSPYQAVFGRVPPLLAEFEPVSECQLDDMSAGIPGMSRNHHRLRELTVQAMVDLTARQRMARALNSKTRVDHGQLNLQPGDQVDFYRKPATKDESGWRGPCQIVQVGPPAVVKWQDRFVQVRTQDLRRSLVYLTMIAPAWCVDVMYYQRKDVWYEVSPDNPADTVRVFAESLTAKTIRLGWLFNEGWRRAEGNRLHSDILWAILHFGIMRFPSTRLYRRQNRMWRTTIGRYCPM